MADNDSLPPHHTDLPESLRNQLDVFRKHLWRIKITEAILAGLFGLILSYVLVFTLDRYFPTPPLARLVILIGGVSLFAIFAPIWINRWVFRHRKENQLARLISKHYPGLGDRLLGVVELQDQQEHTSSMSPRLRAAAMQEVAKEAQRRDLDAALPHSWHKRWVVGVVGLVAITIAAITLTPGAGWNALKRWLMPLSDIERYTKTKIDLEQLPQPYYIAHGEPFSLDVHLTEDSDTPAEARIRQGAKDWNTAQIDQRSYSFALPKMLKDGTLQLRIGDAFQDVEVRPTMRPSLTDIVAKVTYPEYLQRQPTTIDLKSGQATLVQGSTVTLEARFNRPLTSSTASLTYLEAIEPVEEGSDSQQEQGADTSSDPAEELTAIIIEPNKITREVSTVTKGTMVTTAPVTIQHDNVKIPLNWVDHYNLAAAKPTTVSIDQQIDMPPNVYIQGVENELYVLATSSISFDTLAEDDFGLKASGISWEGEFTKPTGGTPARGELPLVSGDPQQLTLSEAVEFSFPAYKIEPQKLTIRAWAEDFKTDHGRIYSEPITIFVLSKDEHRQLIEQRTKEAINRLEDIMRGEQEALDENKRLERLGGKELQKEENKEKLAEQADIETDNAEEMKELAKDMEDIFKEANRNGDIDPKTMKKLSETAQKMREMGEQKMPEVSKELNEAQSQQNTEEQTEQDLKEAIEKQQELLKEMEETIKKANEANKQLEAGTFVNRLRKAAGDEENLANSLIEAASRNTSDSPIAGATFAELDPADQRKYFDLGDLQEQAGSDIRWIQEDLGHFFSRTQQENHKKLFDAMQASGITQDMEVLLGYVKSNSTFKGIHSSKEWAAQLREWAKELENAPEQEPQDGGGGGSPPPSGEDDDFEFMLKVMRMIQVEQDIRGRTRSLEQKRRGLNLRQQNLSAPQQP